MSNSKHEKITKGWYVDMKDADGNSHRSRIYHCKPAADEYVELAKRSGYVEVVLRTKMGYDLRR